MGLYLCVFSDDDELDGVEVGSYSDFAHFRSSVTQSLEGGKAGSNYPTLILHSDSDGEWTVEQCEALKQELESISSQFRRLPAIAIAAGWQSEVARLLTLKPTCLYDCFFDVDGEPLLERLRDLCDVAIENGEPIVFQ